ncbi:glutathione ABC transporter substrate-binding protein [Alkalihalophilus marmarensis]|uniref:ABC transporter substrate-binding protein n=1 Tax=Alkalihalophilus marmarensis DSM 21297 TaxID=1188261 RepID=U6SP49_9BACI|nr:glutathione ABC transporter substrate-binding protein [Alkalihalophilus marmarensis]ERN53494.1 ABC transporter substrate-binding protein [Alkalihalophilus marmarensis DSM 21297]MCM3491679.1 glutathione ABC transporter substrate-binding protein [Alkalihalophilus marmarensis]
MKMSKNSLFAFLLAMVLAFVLAACASEPDSSGEPAGDTDGEDTEAAEGAEGGDLVIATLSDASSLDPASANDVPSTNVTANIFETLINQNAELELEPGLAEEWELIDDNTWEFKIREGITFHDGSELNAEVVKANLDRILDPELASPRSFLISMVTDIEATDEYTLQLTTEYPFSPLPAHLAHNGLAISSLPSIEADQEAVADGGTPGASISANPVGTGFFKFEEWNPGTAVKLVKNEDYWGEPAKVDSVTFSVVPEDLTRIAELETGGAHIIFPVSPSDVTRVENTPEVSLDRTNSVSLSYIGFNMDKEPFDDERVRQAISMAINKEGIISGILDDTGTPAVGPIPPDVFGFDDSVEPLGYDVDAAQELLAEAGLEDGFSTTIWTNDNRERMAIAEYVQAELSKINIDVSVNVMEFGAFLEQTASGEHDMFILGWSVVTGDADYGMYPLFHSSNVGEAGNRTFMKDDELDEILEEARQTADEEDRLALYKQAQEMLVEAAPMIYLYHQEYLVGLRDEVQGFWKHPNGTYMLHEVTIN